MAGVKGRSGRKPGFKHDPAVKTRIAITCWARWQDPAFRALNLPKIMASHPKAVAAAIVERKARAAERRQQRLSAKITVASGGNPV